MAKIKLTDTMAAAMLDTRQTGQGDISWGGMGHSTCNGLVARGLIESRLLRNGDAPGYAGRYPDVQNWHAFLTPAGRIVQESLRADADRRTWTEEELTEQAVPCASPSPDVPGQSCKREAGHAGQCRATVSYVSTQAHWDMDHGRRILEEAQTAGLMGEPAVATPDQICKRERLSSDAVGALVNSAKTGFLHVQTSDKVRSRLYALGLADGDGHLTPEGSRTAYRLRDGSLPPSAAEDPDAGRLTLEQALAEAHTDWRMGEPAVVKIQYADGTTEEIRNIPRGEIAAGIYAEARDNDRVVRAELVRGDGTLAAVYTVAPSIRPPMPRAEVADGVCGRHMGEDVARAHGRKSLAACARMPGHPGRHRNTQGGFTPYTLHWTDEQCAPLDPQP